MYSRKKRRHIFHFTKHKRRLHKFKGGTNSNILTRSQHRLTRRQAQTRGVRVPPLELPSFTRRRRPKRPQQQERQEEQQEEQQQDRDEYEINEDRSNDSASMEMLPERIPNRQNNRDYVPVYVSQSRRLQRQKKFRSKRRRCKKSAILLDVEENCDPMLVPVTSDPVKGDYIVLQNRRIRLKSKFLRGRYRNLQDATLVQIPVMREGSNENLIEVNDDNMTPQEFSSIVSAAASAASSSSPSPRRSQGQQAQEEEEETQAQEEPHDKNTIKYRYEKVGGNGDVNIYINNSLEFLVRESAFLKAIGIGNQKGLYTAKTRHKGDILGRYSGKLLGAEAAIDIEERKDDVPDSRYLLTIVPPRGPRVIIDGAQPLQSPEEQQKVLSFKKKLPNGLIVDSKATQLSLMQYPYPGICAQYMNDAAGPIKFKKIKNNIRFAQNGNIEAIRTIPGYDLSKTFEENIKSEMLVPYGSGYWKDMDKNKITTASVDFCKAIPGQTVASKELFRVKK